jgi:hypothetical protein
MKNIGPYLERSLQLCTYWKQHNLAPVYSTTHVQQSYKTLQFCLSYILHMVMLYFQINEFYISKNLHHERYGSGIILFYFS